MDQLEYTTPEMLLNPDPYLTCALMDFQCCILHPIQSNFDENIW